MENSDIELIKDILQNVIGHLDRLSDRQVSHAGEAPSIEKLRELLPHASFRDAKFLKVLIEARGRVVTDQSLCKTLRLGAPSLKIYASGARRALANSNFPPCLYRKRGTGYYLTNFNFLDLA